MQTFDGRIYAVGECVQHRSATYGLVAPLFDQAKVCANHLAMKGFAAYPGSAVSTRLKVTGIDLFSAGDFASAEGRDEIVLEDSSRGVYKRIVLKDGVVIGAVLYGDTADGGWYFDRIIEKADVVGASRASRLRGGLARPSQRIEEMSVPPALIAANAARGDMTFAPWAERAGA